MFITNMPQYVMKGYLVDALDYVLKPISYYAFSQKSMNERRYSIKKTVAILLFFFAVLTSFMVLTDQISVVFFIPCMLVNVCLIWLSIFACCRMHRKKAAYFCVRAFILGELASSLNWQLFYFGLNNWNVRLTPLFSVLFAYHMQLQELKTKMENEYLQSTLAMQYENYKLSEESVALVNQKYHDLKHQIAILRTSASTQEQMEYLDVLEEEIKSYEAQNKTGNKVLDTILTAKMIRGQKRGITITCVADGQALDFMRPMDISALFGNAMDNAIESVRKLEDKEKRLIHLSVTRQKNFIRIKVENCYSGELTFENGLPKSTKKDKKYHGYGMKSIKKIAEDYNGSVTVAASEGWFELRILLCDCREQGQDQL